MGAPMVSHCSNGTADRGPAGATRVPAPPDADVPYAVRSPISQATAADSWVKYRLGVADR